MQQDGQPARPPVHQSLQVTFHTDPSPFMWGWQRWVLGGSVVAFPGVASLSAVAQPATASTSADSTKPLRIKLAITVEDHLLGPVGKQFQASGNAA